MRDPEAQWATWKDKLEADPQGRATSDALEPGDTDRIYREFIQEMMAKGINGYQRLLTEKLQPLVEVCSLAGGLGGRSWATGMDPRPSWVRV